MERTEARMADVLAALTLAMDLGLGLPVEWVLRCTLTGVRLAEAMELDDDVVGDVYYVSLLRHIGCTSMATEFAHFFGTDLLGAEIVLSDSRSLAGNMTFLTSVGSGEPLLRRMGTVARSMRGPGIGEIETVTCDAACRLAASLGFHEHGIGCLRQSHERWDGRGSPHGLKGDEIDLAVRIAHVAQDLVLCGLVVGPGRVMDEMRKRAGRLLDPEIVDLVPQVELPHEESPVWDEVLAAEPEPRRRIEVDEHMLAAFADFADLKSTYLLGHSRRVAALAAAAGDGLGLTPGEVSGIRLAGLVHDLGRVAVSSSIWDKPGALTALEMEQVRLHPYYTERILSRSSSLGHLAAVASSHHEDVNGGGYHRGVGGPALPMPERVLAAADTYCSLSEPRPQRPAFEPADVSLEMRRQAGNGRLDEYATEAVLEAGGTPSPPSERARDLLTARELQVLRLAARGLTIKEMADRLVISPKTADRHVQNVYTKLDISNRAAAAIWAMEHGLV